MVDSVITSPSEYVAEVNTNKPVFNGQMYIGEPDLDPEIPANQKQVSILNENGTKTPIAQPIAISAGGVFVDDNGDFVRLVVDGNYSQKILDRFGSQVYYIPNAFFGEPIVPGSSGLIYRVEFTNDILNDTISPPAFESDYYDSNKINGSGSKWYKDGTTGTPSTETDTKIFNANGDGYISDSVLVFDSVDDAKATSLYINQKVRTTGFSDSNSNGASDYRIEASQAVDGFADHAVNNGNVIKLVANSEVSPLQLGAAGDNSTDDVLVLNALLSYANSNSLEINGEGKIYYTQAVSGSYDGIIKNLNLRAASVQEWLLRIDVTTELKLYDCDFDCDGVAAKGMYARNQSALETPNFYFINSKSRNFAQDSTTGQAAAVQVEGRFKIASVINPEIENGSSTDGSPVVRGVTFEPDSVNGQSTQYAIVSGGNIINIQASNDADGVNFTLPTGGDLERYRLIVNGTEFRNCSKRSIKSQVRNTVVTDNFFLFEGTPVGSRFAEVEFQQGGGICANNRFYTDCDQLIGFRYVQTSDDDTLIDNNATVIEGNNITSIQGDEYVFAIVTDDTSTPARTLKGIKIVGNTYNGTCQYFAQLNPVAHGAGATTTIIDNLEIASNEMTLVTGAFIWQGRRSGPSVSSRVRLSVHDNMHGDAATVSIPLIFQNTSNLSRVYIKDADNENFDAGI